MAEATPDRASARKGTSSTARRRARSWGRCGKAWCESWLVSPCPGKCLAQAATPADWSPLASAVPRRATSPGSREKLRSPMTGLCGFVSTSTTGA